MLHDFWHVLYPLGYGPMQLDWMNRKEIQIAISPTGTQTEYSVSPASNALHTSISTFGVPYFSHFIRKARNAIIICVYCIKSLTIRLFEWIIYINVTIGIILLETIYIPKYISLALIILVFWVASNTKAYYFQSSSWNFAHTSKCCLLWCTA